MTLGWGSVFTHAKLYCAPHVSCTRTLFRNKHVLMDSWVSGTEESSVTKKSEENKVKSYNEFVFLLNWPKFLNVYVQLVIRYFWSIKYSHSNLKFKDKANKSIKIVLHCVTGDHLTGFSSQGPTQKPLTWANFTSNYLERCQGCDKGTKSPGGSERHFNITCDVGTLQDYGQNTRILGTVGLWQDRTPHTCHILI